MSRQNKLVTRFGGKKSAIPTGTPMRLLFLSTTSVLGGTMNIMSGTNGGVAGTDGGGDVTAGGTEKTFGPGLAFASGPAPVGGFALSGTANFRFSGSDTVANGHRIRYKLYKRATGGTETLIGQYDSGVIGSTWQGYTWSGTIPSTSFLEDERLVCRPFAIDDVNGGTVVAAYIGMSVSDTDSAFHSYVEIPATIAFKADDGSTGGGGGGTGNLLWSTGFESNTALASYNSSASEPSQDVTGTDLTTGSSWASMPFGGNAYIFHLATQAPASNYVTSAIETTTGRTGQSTKALRLSLIQTTQSWTQIELMLDSFSTNITEYYLRTWQRLPANYGTVIPNSGQWISFGTEMKTQDWRYICSVNRLGSGQLNANIKIDTNANFGFPATFLDGLDTTNAAFRPPEDGSWFKNEVYYLRGSATTGRLVLKLNDFTIWDKTMQTYGPYNQSYVNRIFVSTVYGEVYTSYFDDVEFRSTHPW
jgi:hypothetical protein